MTDSAPATVPTEYPLAWCKACEAYMVHCKTCGMNTCSAGYGTVDGEECPDCPAAYEYDEARDKSLEPPPGPPLTFKERYGGLTQKQIFQIFGLIVRNDEED